MAGPRSFRVFERVADPILISGSDCNEELAQVIVNNSRSGLSKFIIGLILPAWFLPSPQATSKQMTGPSVPSEHWARRLPRRESYLVTHLGRETLDTSRDLVQEALY